MTAWNCSELTLYILFQKIYPIRRCLYQIVPQGAVQVAHLLLVVYKMSTPNHFENLVSIERKNV